MSRIKQLSNGSKDFYENYFDWSYSGYNGIDLSVSVPLSDYGRVRSHKINSFGSGYVVGDVVTFTQTEGGGSQEDIICVVAEIGQSGEVYRIVVSDKGNFYTGGTETPNNRAATGGTGTGLIVDFVIEYMWDTLSIDDAGSDYWGGPQIQYAFAHTRVTNPDDIGIEEHLYYEVGSLLLFTGGICIAAIPITSGWFTSEPELVMTETYFLGNDAINVHMDHFLSSGIRTDRMTQIFDDIKQIDHISEQLEEYMAYALENL